MLSTLIPSIYYAFSLKEKKDYENCSNIKMLPEIVISIMTPDLKLSLHRLAKTWQSKNPTDPFTPLELQNTAHDVPELQTIC